MSLSRWLRMGTTVALSLALSATLAGAQGNNRVNFQIGDVLHFDATL